MILNVKFILRQIKNKHIWVCMWIIIVKYLWSYFKLIQRNLVVTEPGHHLELKNNKFSQQVGINKTHFLDEKANAQNITHSIQFGHILN